MLNPRDRLSLKHLRLSRRNMLGLSASLCTSAFMPRLASASAAPDPRLLIVILRGGMDGLNVVVPFGDKNYVPLRGSLALPAASTIQLNTFFGLNPALKNFGAMYKAKNAAIVHAVCVPLRNRSHFDTQANLEAGLPGDTTTANSTGWLNRLLSALPSGNRIELAGAVQIAEAPLILSGPAPVLGWSPTWFKQADATLNAALLNLYKATDAELGENLQYGLEANALANSADPNADAGTTLTQMEKAFRGAGLLLGAANGPRIATISVESFDTHIDEGTTSGPLTNMLSVLDDGLGQFQNAIASNWSQTAVVCVTEFGRTAATNGDKGTDHGTGGVALLAGGAINGGKIFGNWPGLAAANLLDGRDLNPTTDLRSVFKGVLQDHLGVPASILSGTVFPSSTTTAPAMAGLIS